MLEKIKTYLLCALMCGAFFEIQFHIVFYIGILYLVISFFSSQNFNYEWSRINWSWLILYAFVMLITFLYSADKITETPFKWGNAILCFLCCDKDLRNHPKMLLPMLVSMVIVSFVCCVMIQMGIGIGTDDEGLELGEFRLSFFGANENKVSITFCYAIACALYLMFITLQNQTMHKIKKIVVLVGCATIIVADMFSMIYTGSRGGALAALFCIVVFVYYIRSKLESAFVRWVIILTLCFVSYKGYEVIQNTPMFMERIGATEEGDYGGRDVLMLHAIDYFFESPIWGTGLYGIMDYLQNVNGLRQSPHNLFLWILDAGGLIGISLLLNIIFRVARYVLKYKHLLALLVFGIFILDSLKNGAALTSKINYLFLAVALSVSYNQYKGIKL